MKKSKDIKTYITRVTKMVNQIRLAEENFSNSRVVEKVMISVMD